MAFAEEEGGDGFQGVDDREADVLGVGVMGVGFLGVDVLEVDVLDVDDLDLELWGDGGQPPFPGVAAGRDGLGTHGREGREPAASRGGEVPVTTARGRGDWGSLEQGATDRGGQPRSTARKTA